MDIFAHSSSDYLFVKNMNLYEIQSIEKAEDTAKCTLLLNTEHEVYKGHFPGMPILPGALQVEMIKEVLGAVLNKKMRLSSAKSIKYLGFINPNENPNLIFHFKFSYTDGGWNLRASISDTQEEKPQLFMKFSGIFIEA